MISLSLGARIDAKRRSRGGTVGAEDAHAPSAVAPPALDGAGWIGAALRVRPGSWEGRPAPALSIRWQRDGLDIPDATGPDYLPGPEDDGTEIAARVTARNLAGIAEASSPARRIAWPAPANRNPISDQFYLLDSGEHVLDVSSNFGGGALRFSVTGEGVSIDPETGILSIATDALRSGVSVTVTAVNSGGAVAQTFRLDVALPEIALPVAPEMVVAPGLPDIAAIGTKISVEAGTWSGTPAPDLSYQWLRDGIEIAGAVEVSYLPLASEDGDLLACRVTATNSAGTAEAVSSAAEVRHAIPEAVGGLADLLFDAGSGPVTVAAGAEFSGETLVFSVTGAGAEIDSATGLVTISTDDLQSDEAIIVTASNSGGSATSSFRVTVRPVAPELRVAPSLDGTGVIGAPITVEPGLWDGAPEPALSFRWICGGDVVAGAVDAAYVPGLAEDGKDLVCEVTATNAGGSETAETPALALVLPAPVVAGTLADISAEQGAPALSLDSAAVFSGDGLVFAVAGPGAEIDAGTGVLTIATDMVRRDAEMVVMASNSGGSAEIRFRVDITAAAIVPVPPLMLAAPVLVGTAKVGTAMTVETGSWGGDPAPGIACQWLRDGVPIEGAVGTDYVATAEDDLAEIACRVTATNTGGSAEALTAALSVTHVAPVAKGALFEEILDAGTGPQEIPTAQDFEGEALAFAVAGAGATIDAATGVVSIPTETPVDGAAVTVTASNSGGAAESSFLVTIEAAEVEVPDGPPASLADDQWQILRSEPSPEIAADSFRPVVSIDASIPVEAAQWTTSGQTPALPEHWQTLAPSGEPNIFTTEMLNKDVGDRHVFAEPQARRADFRIRYRVVADGAWSEESPVKLVPLPEAPEPDAAPVFPTMDAGRMAIAAGRDTVKFYRTAVQSAGTNGGKIGPSHYALAQNAFLGVTKYDNDLKAQADVWIGGTPSNKNVLGFNASGNYVIQYEIFAVQTLALMLRTPRFSAWFDANNRRERAEFAIEMLAYAGCYMSSADWLTPGVRKTSPLDGESTYGQSSNSNRRNPQVHAMATAAAYFGAATFSDMVRNFRHSVVLAKMKSYGWDNMTRTWEFPKKNQAKEPLPIATLESIIRGGALGNSRGWRYFAADDLGIEQWREIVYNELHNDCFGYPIVRGMNQSSNGGIGALINGKRWGTMITPTTSPTDPVVLGMPYPIGTPTGGCREFDANDFGALGRAHMGYVMGGIRPATTTLSCLILMGAWDRNANDLQQIMDRYIVGTSDARYKVLVGHRNYANGRTQGEWTGTLSSDEATNFGMTYSFELMEWLAEATGRQLDASEDTPDVPVDTYSHQMTVGDNGTVTGFSSAIGASSISPATLPGGATILTLGGRPAGPFFRIDISSEDAAIYGTGDWEVTIEGWNSGLPLYAGWNPDQNRWQTGTPNEVRAYLLTRVGDTIGVNIARP